MLGRLLRPADFECVLAAPVRARSAHFAAHHLALRPGIPRKVASWLRKPELSTIDPDTCTQSVDESLAPGPAGWWFGVVVPKRHARKATTRNLLRRQMRNALARHHEQLARGMWLVRLRAPFAAQAFKAAASAALREAARSELDGLLKRAAA